MVTKYYNEIEDFAKAIKKGTFGLYCATYTPMQLNKYPNDKERNQALMDNEYNKYEGRVSAITVYQNACTGVNFYNCVQSECKRENIIFSDKEFQEAFSTQKSYCESVSKELDDIIMKHVEKEQKYLRLYLGRKPTKYHKIILLDGHVATDEELRDIKRFMRKKTEYKKQTSIGIKNIIIPLNVKIENVIFIAQGEKAWKNTKNMGELDDINKMIGYIKVSSKKNKI